MKTAIQDIMERAVKSVQKQQEKLIKDRLFAILGYELDIEEEGKRRFPRLGIFQQENETHYYWNDGSANGVRIITFVQEPINFDLINDNKLSINYSYK